MLRMLCFILLSLLLSFYHHLLIVHTWNYSYNGRASTPDCWKVDPLGAFTPECDRALQEAQAARERGLHLRQETADLIDKCDKLKKSVAKSVNDGITQKMGETTSLKVRVIVSVDHMTRKEKNVFSFAYCHLAFFLLSRWFLSATCKHNLLYVCTYTSLKCSLQI